MQAITGSEFINISDLFEEHEAKLNRFAIYLSRDQDWADDLVQETFIQALLHLSQLSLLNPHQRRAWLYKVLRNRFIDQQRAKKREEAFLTRLAELTQPDSDLVSSFVLSGNFNQVPEKFREVIYKHYVLEMTSEEIGKEMNLPPGTVRSRLHLAIQWLRKHHTLILEERSLK